MVLFLVIAGVGPYVLRLPRRAEHAVHLCYARPVGLAALGAVAIAAIGVAVMPTPTLPQAFAPPSPSLSAEPPTTPSSASQGPKPEFANFVTSLDVLKNGDPIEASDNCVLPYGLTVPSPEYAGWCGEPSTTAFRKKGVNVGGYARALIQNGVFPILSIGSLTFGIASGLITVGLIIWGVRRNRDGRLRARRLAQ